MRQLQLDLDSRHPALRRWFVRVVITAFAIGVAGTALLYLSFAAADRRQDAAEAASFENSAAIATEAPQAPDLPTWI